ncbi:Tetratricopeptide repeat-containing protein [Streptomyces sp. DI166]|nr:Tetratricopeptide repeat-containing protein [Streptomyces sp. DI166]
MCRHVLGQYDEALADFNRSYAIDDSLFTLVRRARLRYTRGESAQADADFDLAAARAPDVAWIASERGDHYRLTGRHEEASAALRDCLSREPEDANSWAILGELHRLRGEYEEALRHLDHALSPSPDYGYAYAERARVYVALGRTEEARADLERSPTRDGS